MPYLAQRFQRICARIQKIVMKYGLHVLRHKPEGIAKFKGFRVAYPDKSSFYMEYKDIFFHRIYHFTSPTPFPVIIDGGGCIGMSVLYFKSIYPQAKIVCFEPDEKLFRLLQTNLEQNHIHDVELVQAALSDHVGTARFQADASDQGKILAASAEAAMVVNTARLSSYLTTPVDFLKLNIEGQELPTLLEIEASGKLPNIREMVIEYHGWAEAEQRLGDLLNLLKRNGFRYFVHDFDDETCGASKPPFRWTPQTDWFCLVYAKRVSSC